MAAPTATQRYIGDANRWKALSKQRRRELHEEFCNAAACGTTLTPDKAQLKADAQADTRKRKLQAQDKASAPAAPSLSQRTEQEAAKQTSVQSASPLGQVPIGAYLAPVAATSPPSPGSPTPSPVPGAGGAPADAATVVAAPSAAAFQVHDIVRIPPDDAQYEVVVIKENPKAVDGRDYYIAHRVPGRLLGMPHVAEGGAAKRMIKIHAGNDAPVDTSA